MKTVYMKILYISELINTHILKNILRFFDVFGSGSYNSTNGNRKNKSVDFICIPGACVPNSFYLTLNQEVKL